MTNSKHTKKALGSSIVALLLCFTMLMGATFPWFTVNVSSTGNRIQAGDLEVDLVMYDGSKYVSIGGDDGDIFSQAAGGNGINWEPGKTEIVYLGVKNNGSLALKYNILLDIIDGNPGLIGSLEYAIIDEATSADTYANWEAVKAASNGQTGDLPSGKVVAAQGGVLDEIIKAEDPRNVEDKDREVDYFALAVHMKEEATNEFENGTVTIDVNVIATQKDAEEDSFGPDYDEEAPFGSYTEVASSADFLTALAAADADYPLTIKLNGDIEWATEDSHGEKDISPASAITIDGNGHTITATGAGVTPLGDNDAPMTLKNVTIVDESVSYNETAWEFSYLELGGSVLNCVNVKFADPVMVESDSASFVNCSFTGKNDKNSNIAMYGVWVSNGDATFTNCSFSGTRGLKVCDQYAPEVGNVVVDGCTFIGLTQKPGIALDDHEDRAMNITIKNSTFINCQPGDQGLYIYETDNVVPTLSNNTVLSNATFVSSKDELLALSAKALTRNNSTAEEATIIIDDDIDMQNADFSSIIAQRGDKLTIIGNGHTISNVNVISGADDNTTGQAGMFYTYPSSTLVISDLTLENITVTADENGTGYAGAVVGYCEGALELNNVDVVKANVTGVKSSGIVIGHMSGSLVAKDCDFSGSVTLADFDGEANGHYAGKYIGTLAGSATVTNCTADVTVRGNLTADNNKDSENYGRATTAGSWN